MPPYIKHYGSEPKLTPEDYWIKFCEYMYLTQGVDADKEVDFDAERKNPANAEKVYDKDRVTENEKNVPIIKSGFLWNLGEPAVRTLETRFAGAKLNTKSIHEILEEWKKCWTVELNKIGKYTQLLNTTQKEGQADLDYWFKCNEMVAKCATATDNADTIAKVLTQVVFFNGLRNKSEAQKYRDWVFLKNKSFEDLQKHLNNNKVNKKTTEMLKIKSEPIGKVDESSGEESEPERRSRSRTKQKSKPIRKNTEHSKECYQCGDPWDPKHKPVCKAKNKKCARCGKIGHLKKVCRSKTTRPGFVDKKENLGRIEEVKTETETESEDPRTESESEPDQQQTEQMKAATERLGKISEITTETEETETEESETEPESTPSESESESEPETETEVINEDDPRAVIVKINEPEKDKVAPEVIYRLNDNMEN